MGTPQDNPDESSFYRRMMTEAMHNPLLMDRLESVKSVNCIFGAERGLKGSDSCR